MKKYNIQNWSPKISHDCVPLWLTHKAAWKIQWRFVFFCTLHCGLHMYLALWLHMYLALWLHMYLALWLHMYLALWPALVPCTEACTCTLHCGLHMYLALRPANVPCTEACTGQFLSWWGSWSSWGYCEALPPCPPYISPRQLTFYNLKTDAKYIAVVLVRRKRNSCYLSLYIIQIKIQIS